ncbi:DNA-binding SARP family transcriptional activator [Streptosporangium becharense]|uniref:DNA-binding SARP family transcriptional activator n=1 Tax=Streptosporangium becharense TaxID=1816182 RepID=A0A7W9MHQ1_9ACTN|nr:BTAD domain-containing putative transcriptional regulator [Streptosporangium becharense]MBB2913972.1 DNA-binding SARP family transcriptional activator [Streptosporangium becharense]MBB5821367.1 DNA-binding SARP family transcriptional activator [Streptosporangium becharense]
MQFRVLGPVEADDDGIPVDLGGPRQRAVLARLILSRGTVVPVDVLIDDVYGSTPPASALATLQSYISHLRRAVEPGRAPRAPSRVIIARPPGYLLAAADVDVARFTELVTRSAFRSPDGTLPCLDEALGLWRGQPYSEFADEPWAAAEVGRLHELRLTAIERRARALLELGRPLTAVADLEAEVIAHPRREGLWYLLALALHRAGRKADALEVLRRAESRLTGRSGLPPGAALKRLEDDIVRGVDSPTVVPQTEAAADPVRLSATEPVRDLLDNPVRNPAGGTSDAGVGTGAAPVSGAATRTGAVPGSGAAPVSGATHGTGAVPGVTTGFPSAAARIAAGTGKAPAASPRPPRRPLYGREQQLAELATLPARAAGNGTAVAAVSGEAGIGKTLLLETFGEHCAGLGHLVLWGRCHDSDRTPPLWPWLQALRTLRSTCPPPDGLVLAGLSDIETPDGPDGSTASATGAARLGRSWAVSRWLATAARDRPLTIILDDLHWADPASLELLGDMVMLTDGLARSVPLTLVVAFRDIAVTEGCVSGCAAEKLLGRLARYNLLRLRLTGVCLPAVRAIVADAGVEADECTIRWLAERTGGNPFFVRESARLLAQGRDAGTVPDAVADLIRQCLTDLGPGAGQTLVTAAVVGRDFDPGLVAEISGVETYDLLDRAARAGLVVPRGDRMSFAHDMIRETLLRDMPPLRKAMVHRRVMAALASRPGVDVTVVAHHALEASPMVYE